ncbi:hypothetical protein [Cohaesibacter celericrescens]|uniref:hypothetical protein n=1 Tax=Cohaesibacter celericrescens TaxID=2067669 RepID=UPI0011AEF764|nr:hypothetical protein [Cohaesibacter celericrescens]
MAAISAFAIGWPTLKWLRFQAQLPEFQKEIDQISKSIEALQEGAGAFDNVAFPVSQRDDEIVQDIKQYNRKAASAFLDKCVAVPNIPEIDAIRSEFREFFKPVRLRIVKEMRNYLNEHQNRNQLIKQEELFDEVEEKFASFYDQRYKTLINRRKELNSHISNHRLR